MKGGASQPVIILNREQSWRLSEEFAHVQPAVLHDAVSTDLLDRWGPDQLRARIGSMPITVNVREEHFDFECWRVEQQRNPARAEEMMNLQRMPLETALSEIIVPARGGAKRDLAITGVDCSILGSPETALHLCPPALELGCVRPNLWAAGPPRRHQAHFDPGDVFIVVVYGFKRFILASPTATANLYPYPGHAALSRIPDLLHADIVQWPLFDTVDLWLADLRPGDVLYIPQGWWHQCDYLAPSLSLSFWP